MPPICIGQCCRLTGLVKAALPHEFREAVDRAVIQFFIEKPEKASWQVGRIYREKGPAAAATLLRELTDPQAVSALILNKAWPMPEGDRLLQ